MLRPVAVLMLRIASVATALTLVGQAPAQTPAAQPDRLVAQSNVLDIRDGDTMNTGTWTLVREANPDIYTARIARRGERQQVCFVSGPNSLCRMVGEGDSHDFVVSFQGHDYPTRIVGRYIPPMAVFDEAYRRAHRDQITIQVPEVYELVNVAIALTAHARANRWLVWRDSPYHAELEKHFASVADHPFVRALNALMTEDPNRYFVLKMNAYAFDYDANGRIVRSPIYDRTGFPDNPDNTLLPLLEEMRSFSEASRFRAFYAAHRSVYDGQIAEIRERIDIQRMVRWLKREFPRVRPYDHIKIVFSPLVYANQSVTWIETEGFRELQPHVNFPYPANFTLPVSEDARLLQRGNLLFTEINHGFINPTADGHAQAIRNAVGDLSYWRGSVGAGNYNSPMATFNEMMNWGLVILYYVDFAPPADLEALTAANDTNQVERRGFARFREFSQFLVRLYRERPAGTTLADLYPQIIAWFARQPRTPPAPAG